ncbi:unannotated protein [freshwater metagenome]|uniref:Unannotated protein n=1 Tax=freshwater metagenome TaxID=449393 RepID=A0A6J7GTX0_9ZZZZ
MLALGDLVGGGDDRIGQCAVEQTEILVDLRACCLEQAHRADLGALERAARDGEVLHRTLRLGAPERVDGDANLSHGVVFDPELLFVCLRHEPYFASRGFGDQKDGAWPDSSASKSTEEYSRSFSRRW